MSPCFKAVPLRIPAWEPRSARSGDPPFSTALSAPIFRPAR